MENSGINLPETSRKKVIELNNEINYLSEQAQTNINEDTNWIPVELSKLTYLQQDALD